ncbi:hypothetical protein [Coxiella endosymbiont of Ornithodoros maritimus]|uniref:hypothetical protein n=1 Tax=Coxiella endosymbiont of Ornithodoros maritimus TaxID=1656172 RepID=UPI00226478D8|nr:hypothetical protein [Coxiella endosymbiont of Ornithodoros maritimus]
MKNPQSVFVSLLGGNEDTYSQALELLSLFEKHQFKSAIVDLGQLSRIQSFAISRQDGMIYKFDLRDELLIFDRYVDHHQHYLLAKKEKIELVIQDNLYFIDLKTLL